MKLLDVATSLVEGVADKLDPSKHIERVGQRMAISAVAAGVAAIGAAYLSLAAFFGLRHFLSPALAALICAAGLFAAAGVIIWVGRTVIRQQEARKAAQERAMLAERYAEAARQVGEIAGGIVRDNSGALLAAAFAFGLTKGLGSGRKPPPDPD